MSKKRAIRLLAVLASGGVMFQAAGGCVTTFTPLLLSVAESVILSTLAAGFAG
jgi:hypothetical protein